MSGRTFAPLAVAVVAGGVVVAHDLAEEHVRAAARTGVRDQRHGVVGIVDVGARRVARGQ
jgi:hypothetical protein